AIDQIDSVLLSGDVLNVLHQVRRSDLPASGPLQEQLGPKVQASSIDFAGQRIQRRRRYLCQHLWRGIERKLGFGRRSPDNAGSPNSGSPGSGEYSLGIPGSRSESTGQCSHPDAAGEDPATIASGNKMEARAPAAP